ncbi:hypothetical protein [Sphingomonas sp. M1-B02]|uniref:hypothetical protein n=1 Tax=Sphingomonas sp. M1-B02 TaxID=3114300 RepID=UPI002240C5BB|nr:hypothetical protein [Sphingomonas sp. S6-11]UZK66175.1 hypothetical protein OKW87_16965 [Sphingomonas sp. S6-11]
MATLAGPMPGLGRDDRFFLTMAIAMALTIVAGFSVQVAMGRSTFAAPPLVHFHAFVFFGWVVIYVAQNVLVTRGSMALHRRLGWLAAGWASAMVVVGIYTTVTMVRFASSPFFFRPAYFLVMNSLSVIAFAGLVAAAIALRRRTEWHRRLLFCGMAILTGPALGRLLPLPLMMPYAEWGVFVGVMLFPLVGVIADLRRRGGIHPAWWWGLATIVAMQVSMTLLAYSPLGLSIYGAATRGYPGEAVAPLEFPPPPGGPLITGRDTAI